jgi:hypothetical protein
MFGSTFSVRQILVFPREELNEFAFDLTPAITAHKKRANEAEPEEVKESKVAKSEIKVAYYYFKKGAYVAAINRAQTTLNDYQNIAAVEDALIILIDSYEALGLTKLKEDTIRVLESSYPQSQYFTDKAPPPLPASPSKRWYQFW